MLRRVLSLVFIYASAVTLAFAETPARFTPAGYGYGEERGAVSGPVLDLRGQLPPAPAPRLPAKPVLPPPAPPSVEATVEAPAVVSEPDETVTALGKEGRGERYNLGQEKTASGELFDPAQLTGAAADMPLSSLALVTNLENNKEVIVRVNDRPSRRDRVAQLSPRAADYIGLSQSDARVRVRYLGPAPRLTAKTQPNPVYAEPLPAAVIQEPTQAIAPSPAATTVDDQPRGGTYGVQIGAFGERANAERARERAEEAGPVSISQAQVGASTIYRVRIGPWVDRADAENARKKAVTLGFNDARVTDR